MLKQLLLFGICFLVMVSFVSADFKSDLEAKLVHYWKLDETVGATTAVDAKGYSDLTKQGNAGDFVDGNFMNNAFNFSGVDTARLNGTTLDSKMCFVIKDSFFFIYLGSGF